MQRAEVSGESGRDVGALRYLVPYGPYRFTWSTVIRALIAGVIIGIGLEGTIGFF